METVLGQVEIRVLGCLIEKEMTTPDYYPLTLNAVVAACNQKSNRDPAMSVDEATVVRVLDDLRYKHGLAGQVTISGARVPKYRHDMAGKYGLLPPDMAILCELFVRGPQTVGELRVHASRMHSFQATAEVEAVLNGLAQREDGPYVRQLPREAGRREQRWAHLFGGEVKVEAAPDGGGAEPVRVQVVAENERIGALERDVASLRETVEQLKQQFEEFKKQLE